MPPVTGPVDGCSLRSRGSSTYSKVADELASTPGARAVRTKAASATGQAGVTHILRLGPIRREIPALLVAADAK